MGINATEISYAFGQLGSVFNNTASAIAPPTGKAFCSNYIFRRYDFKRNSWYGS